jgi:hypothetical protein
MNKAADDMTHSVPSDVFPDRHKEHIAYALRMVASGGFLSSPAAIGSVYLATRFEYYFRVLSGRLNADGTWNLTKINGNTGHLDRGERIGKIPH